MNPEATAQKQESRIILHQIFETFPDIDMQRNYPHAGVANYTKA